MTWKIKAITYLSAIASFIMFVYAIFGPDQDLRDQALYWFLSVIALVLVPELREVRYRDLTVKMNTLEEKVDTVSRQLINFDTARDLIHAYPGLPLDVQAMMAEKARERFKHALEGASEHEVRDQLQLLIYEDFAKKLEVMPKEDASAARTAFTVSHLESMGVTIPELKGKLSQLGFYKGGKDERYDNQLESAILAFQKQYKVNPVDGICGRITYDQIQRVIQEEGL